MGTALPKLEDIVERKMGRTRGAIFGIFFASRIMACLEQDITGAYYFLRSMGLWASGGHAGGVYP